MIGDWSIHRGRRGIEISIEVGHEDNEAGEWSVGVYTLEEAIRLKHALIAAVNEARKRETALKETAPHD